MVWKHMGLAAGVAAASIVHVGTARAESCATISRANLVACALRGSLDPAAPPALVRAAEGRARAAEPWFPSSPNLELRGARREAAGETAFNWSAALAVELDLGGQRGARRGAALAEKAAAEHGLIAAQRSAVVQAFRAYFEALAARQQGQVLARLEASARRVREAARGAAERGTAPGVEVDLADAALAAIAKQRVEANLAEQQARVALAEIAGGEPSRPPEVSGELAPLARAAELAAASSGRTKGAEPATPALRALEADRRAFRARASSYRRARVPNPTLSVFVEEDGFGENVLGAGVSLPLPLPEPLGRMYRGEVAENEALAERAELLARRERRLTEAELRRASLAHAAAAELARETSPERLARVEQTLEHAATEVLAGRLAIREAVAIQVPLLHLLLQAIDARKALCLSSLELARAAGLPLERGEP